MGWKYSWPTARYAFLAHSEARWLLLAFFTTTYLDMQPFSYFLYSRMNGHSLPLTFFMPTMEHLKQAWVSSNSSSSSRVVKSGLKTRNHLLPFMARFGCFFFEFEKWWVSIKLNSAEDECRQKKRIPGALPTPTMAEVHQRWHNELKKLGNLLHQQFYYAVFASQIMQKVRTVPRREKRHECHAYLIKMNTILSRWKQLWSQKLFQATLESSAWL